MARQRVKQAIVVVSPKRQPKTRNPRRRRNRAGGNPSTKPFRMTERTAFMGGAPAALGLRKRRPGPAGYLRPMTRFATTDLLDVVELGPEEMQVVYNVRLGPQDMPIGSRAKSMSMMFAKYRPVKVTIRINSAISTASNGQYAAFFDPNPDNNWQSGADVVGALTSMPVNDDKQAWQNMELVIPPAVLEQDTELYTQESEGQTLVTRFGQLVILTLIPTTLTGNAGSLTVWLDAEWDFYEPNASAQQTRTPIVFPAGNWHIGASTGYVATPNPISGQFLNNSVYKLHPELPGSMLQDGVASPWMAQYKDKNQLLVFDTEENATNYAKSNVVSGEQGQGVTPSQNLPPMVAVIQDRFTVTRVFPYNRKALQSDRVVADHPVETIRPIDRRLEQLKLENNSEFDIVRPAFVDRAEIVDEDHLN